jgi:tRNA pseudouridine38-40 synthase
VAERHIKLTIEYDGTDFSGWQRQANAPSVQQTIEEALAGMCHAPVILRGAGRTDAGVHARGQVACFFTDTHIPVRGFVRGLNSVLPRSIGIRAGEEVAPDFDARRSARGKHYRYQVWNAEERAPLVDRYAWHVITPLDLAAMQAGATHLLGEHDFSAYRAADCDRNNPVRVLTRCDVAREGDLIHFDVEGTAFLKNMVRIIVGTLTEVGHGRRTPENVAEVLASRDRRLAGRTAAPRGLTMVRVLY